MYESHIASHLKPLLGEGRLANLAPTIIDDLRRYDRHTPFDSIAVTGTSGLVLSGHIAINLGKNIVVVHPRGVERHGEHMADGVMTGRYLFFDDLICTGNTFRRVVSIIESELCEYASCVGVYLFTDGYMFPEGRGFLHLHQIRELLET